MKNSTSIFFSFLLGGCLLSGCKKEEPINNPMHEKLLGSWEWIGSYGGYSFTTITPSSEGYTVRIEFTRDGRRKLYINNKQTSVVKYSIIEDESIFKAGKTFQVKLDTEVGIFLAKSKHNRYTQETIDFRGEDTLGLSEEAYDAFGHRYVRVK